MIMVIILTLLITIITLITIIMLVTIIKLITIIILIIIIIILFTTLKRKCLQINDLVSALSAAECESAQSTIEV